MKKKNYDHLSDTGSRDKPSFKDISVSTPSFNLSKKIIYKDLHGYKEEYLHIEYVKEFIKRLKKKLPEYYIVNKKTKGKMVKMQDIINALAGGRLS